MAEYRNTLCCGVAEVHGIQSLVNMKEKDDLAAEIWLKDFIVRECASNLPRKSHLFFTQAVSASMRDHYGDQFRQFIERAGLGTVWASPAMPNPNTSNLVTLYVWTVNRDAFKLWAEKHKLLRDSFGRPLKDGWLPLYDTYGQQQVPAAPAPQPPTSAPAPPARTSRAAVQPPTAAAQAAYPNAVNRVLNVDPNRGTVSGGGGAGGNGVAENINPF